MTTGFRHLCKHYLNKLVAHSTDVGVPVEEHEIDEIYRAWKMLDTLCWDGLECGLEVEEMEKIFGRIRPWSTKHCATRNVFVNGNDSDSMLTATIRRKKLFNETGVFYHD